MPVQVDTISEYVQEVREKYGVKVYGFCHSHVSLGIFELTQNRTICFLKQMKSIHYRLQFSNSSEECVWSPPKNFSKR